MAATRFGSVPAPTILATFAALAGFLAVVPIRVFDGFVAALFFTIFFFMVRKNITHVAQEPRLCGFCRYVAAFSRASTPATGGTPFRDDCAYSFLPQKARQTTCPMQGSKRLDRSRTRAHHAASPESYRPRDR